MLIVMLFTVCWIPYCAFESIVRLLRGFEVIYFSTDFVPAHKFLYLLVTFNCLLDPFIYAVRMREVQRGQHRQNLNLYSHTAWVINRMF